MDESDAEIHPLDRDYSVPVQPRRERLNFHPKLRRAGVYVFASGIVLMFLAAILLSNFNGVRTVETIGSTVHRLGMLTGLAGGLLVVLAYRWEQLTRLADSKPSHRAGSRPFMRLLILNVAVLAAFFFLVVFVGLGGSTMLYLLFTGIVPVTLSFIVTLAIWHAGYIRAYAIAFLATGFMISISNLFTFQWRIRGGGDWNFFFISNIAVCMVSGLISSRYVLWLESARSDRPRE